VPTAQGRRVDPACHEPHPAEARLGGPEYYRIWCSATDNPANKYQSVEFCGWLVGWGASELAAPLEAFRFGDAGLATRVEADIFLSTDGRIVTALELLPATAWEFASSPPDLWTAFLGWDESLAGAAAWLRRVQPYHSPEGDCCATVDALNQARDTLAAVAIEPLEGEAPPRRRRRKQGRAAGASR